MDTIKTVYFGIYGQNENNSIKRALVYKSSMNTTMYTGATKTVVNNEDYSVYWCYEHVYKRPQLQIVVYTGALNTYKRQQ